MNHHTARLFGTLVLGLFGAACVTTTDGRKPSVDRPESDWVMASASLRDDIEQQAAALPYRHGPDRIEAISWFAGVGEPAYDTLLDFLSDERPEVVASALAALGATGDHRLVPHVVAAENPDWSRTLTLESARTRVRLGDWDAMPVLIEGLESEQHFERALCADSLFMATRERFGFTAGAALPERQAAISRWRDWWTRRSGDQLLAGGKDAPR